MDVALRSACYHCGESVEGGGVRRLVAGEPRAFCCAGCSAAAEWIADAQLGDYYRLRSARGNRVAADAPDYAAWDGDSVLAEHARQVDGALEITVLTQGMHCAACAWLIDQALRREDGVADVVANAVTGRVQLRWDPVRTTLSRLMLRLDALGYRPWLASGDTRERELRRERRRWLMRVGVAGLGAMQAMMFAEVLYLDTRGEMALATRDFFRWVTFLVATPVVFYSGWPFLQGMAREWRGRRLGMDTLVAGSTLLAWAASVVETLRGGPQVWYDAAVMFVLLLLVARMLEQQARALASARVDALGRARPALATRERGDGGREQVALAELREGDVLRVADGEAVPADGELLGESARFDESLLTGESTPVHRAAGEPALAGSVCVGADARLRVLRTGSRTRLSELSRLVEQAQASRPAVARLADRVAGVFVAGLLLAAVAVYAWWRMHDPARAFEVALSLLVVSCPCALSLAVPAALAAAHGRLAAIGVLVLEPDALDALARVDRVVFDKTGTLTAPTRSIASMALCQVEDPKRLLAIAAALERGSRHPIASAFRGHDTGLPVDGLRSVPNAGIEGSVGGQRWRIGRAAFAGGSGEPGDDGRLWLGDGRQPAASFQLREDLRDDAAAAVGDLHRAGVGVEICSGDSVAAVAALAAALDIREHTARQSPEHKLARVRAHQARGEVVAMVGDGINDAPVLAGADVSLALAEGAAIAQRAAGIVVTSPSLLRIPEAIAVARKARRIVRQNLGWAVAYNLLALPLAASGAFSPWQAALGMAGSSLVVTLNALRLSRRKPAP